MIILLCALSAQAQSAATTQAPPQVVVTRVDAEEVSPRLGFVTRGKRSPRPSQPQAIATGSCPTADPSDPDSEGFDATRDAAFVDSTINPLRGWIADHGVNALDRECGNYTFSSYPARSFGGEMQPFMTCAWTEDNGSDAACVNWVTTDVEMGDACPTSSWQGVWTKFIGAVANCDPIDLSASNIRAMSMEQQEKAAQAEKDRVEASGS